MIRAYVVPSLAVGVVGGFLAALSGNSAGPVIGTFVLGVVVTGLIIFAFDVMNDGD